MKKVLFILIVVTAVIFTVINYKRVLPFIPVSDTAPLPIQPEVQKDLQPSEDSVSITTSIFVDGISGARDLTFSPGGILLVSSPSQGRVFALPDKNNNGEADAKESVIDGLSGPHGITFYKGKLFVVAQRAVYRYIWDEQNMSATLEKKLFAIPGGGGHTNYSIVFHNDTMLVALGSTCNVCAEAHPFRATVIASDENGTNPRVFTKGLRNATFFAIHPETNQVWVSEMGRDNLGDDLPPDEINILKEGQDYGWPYCYGEKIHDDNFDPDNIVSCTNTQTPLYKIQAHSAPLGLTFIDSPQFPQSWQGDLLVSYHGSWNRSVPTGYKIVHLKVDGNTVNNEETILDFDNGNKGRPVDLIFDKKGNLFVSDDKRGVVYLLHK